LLDCLVLGDSIAVGVGQAKPACHVVAEVGITSERYVHTRLIAHTAHTARIAIISLGVNDSADVDTVDNLLRLRHAITARTVYWLLAGTNQRARDAARMVAFRFHDRLIDVAPLAGPDHLHPDRAGYARLASITRAGTGSVSAQRAAYHDFQPRNTVYGDFRNPVSSNAQYHVTSRSSPATTQR
jgi:lysophospholipase L1-like esterase